MHNYTKIHVRPEYDPSNRTPDIDLLRAALIKSGYSPLDLSLNVIRRDYRVIRESNYDVTVTLLWDGTLFRVCRIEAGDTSAQLYGLAVDLGSTTVVARVVDLRTRKVYPEASVENRQRLHGEDILSRIFYSHDDPEKIAEIQQLTADSINAACSEACLNAGIRYESVNFVSVAGNTTMIHFLLGLDAFCVFLEPFIAHIGSVGWIPADELHLKAPGFVFCFPSAANYLGGDIISGVLSTGMIQRDSISLFIDIGTNGEMVIGNKEFLIGGAGAAGPALEAGISKSGMRASDGAIDTIRIENDALTFTVIGNCKPKGICGSGIADLLAQMLLAGWMDVRGKLRPNVSDRIIEVDISEDDEPRFVPAVVYALASETEGGEPLVFTQKDIEEFTASKAAAHTMVESLLRESGVSMEDVDRIYLAGAFGKYVSLESAITIGMYPDIPRDRFVPVGNSSLQGAVNFLLNSFSADDANETAERIYFLEFALQQDFLNMMRAASFYPHTDLDAYPTVAEKLRKLSN